MSELIRKIRSAQVRAGEQVVIDHLEEIGLGKPKPVAGVDALTLEDGKYTFRMEGFSLYCDRYGEPWREFVGDKAISALYVHARDMRRAIDDALVVAHIYNAQRHADVRLALQDLIEWNVKIALDPKVSSDARELIELGAASERSL